jgi:signal transduction histidine kinase
MTRRRRLLSLVIGRKRLRGVHIAPRRVKTATDVTQTGDREMISHEHIQGPQPVVGGEEEIVWSEAMPLPLVALDGRGCVRRINRAALELLGTERHRIYGSPLIGRIVAADRPGLLEALARCRAGQPIAATDMLVLRRDGTTVGVRLLSSRGAGPDRYYAALLDRSELDLLDERVAELEAEVRRQRDCARDQANTLRDVRRQLVLAQSTERRRVSAVLHDGLQQLLFAARLKLSGVPVLAEGRERLDAVDELLRSALEACHTLAADLNPPLATASLLEALSLLADRMATQHGLRVEISGSTLPLTLEAKNVLFECARELLFNVVKHAGTAVACVRLVADNESVTLVVSDRGRGFSAGGLRPGSGLGLRALAENVRAFGGTLQLESAAAEGTRVCVKLPLAVAVVARAAPETAVRTRRPSGLRLKADAADIIDRAAAKSSGRSS